MFLNHKSLSLLTRIALVGVFALGFLTEIQAADKSDAAGTWTWSMPGRNGGPERKFTLKVKADGDKLVGTLVSPGRNGQTRETQIKDIKVDASEITFKVVRENNGNTMTTKSQCQDHRRHPQG